ncbi:hypothetical protein [Peribacillus huizhouensis]|uniref:Uncharacterized protein n=1 Tax=Peribacillus huizhouensis TaxID=1501239 RepID=A0ABR6CVE2_9BACI|nr:hypothetical protein [Peribacillus huizhouensis]MBA9028994.1 hypothetical protein [Peribacillus huizhouensis]
MNIARLDSLVTHTPEWWDNWVADGYDKDTNKFYAGEKFIIRLKSSPAAYVWGEVDFGGSVGKVNIPQSALKLVSTSTYEYISEAELWRDDLVKIKNGGYMFNFHSMHPVNSLYKQADDHYIIEIVGDIYDYFQFHQRY